jgi:hypothetical protein
MYNHQAFTNMWLVLKTHMQSCLVIGECAACMLNELKKKWRNGWKTKSECKTNLLLQIILGPGVTWAGAGAWRWTGRDVYTRLLCRSLRRRLASELNFFIAKLLTVLNEQWRCLHATRIFVLVILAGEHKASEVRCHTMQGAMSHKSRGKKGGRWWTGSIVRLML